MMNNAQINNDANPAGRGRGRGGGRGGARRGGNGAGGKGAGGEDAGGRGRGRPFNWGTATDAMKKTEYDKIVRKLREKLGTAQAAMAYAKVLEAQLDARDRNINVGHLRMPLHNGAAVQAPGAGDEAPPAETQFTITDKCRKAGAFVALRDQNGYDKGLKLNELATHDVVACVANEDSAEGRRMTALQDNASEQAAALTMRHGEYTCPVTLEAITSEDVYEGPCGHLVSTGAVKSMCGPGGDELPPVDGSMRCPQCRKPFFCTRDRWMKWCVALETVRTERTPAPAESGNDEQVAAAIRGGDYRIVEVPIPAELQVPYDGSDGGVKGWGEGNLTWQRFEMKKNRVSRVRDLPSGSRTGDNGDVRLAEPASFGLRMHLLNLTDAMGGPFKVYHGDGSISGGPGWLRLAMPYTLPEAPAPADPAADAAPSSHSSPDSVVDDDVEEDIEPPPPAAAAAPVIVPVGDSPVLNPALIRRERPDAEDEPPSQRQRVEPPVEPEPAAMVSEVDPAEAGRRAALAELSAMRNERARAAEGRANILGVDVGPWH